MAANPVGGSPDGDGTKGMPVCSYDIIFIAALGGDDMLVSVFNFLHA